MENKASVKKLVFEIIVALVIIIVVFLFLQSCYNSSLKPQVKSEQSQQIEALVGSQMVVKDSLKSPSSAKFPTIVDSNISINKISTDKYSVTAYVDSQNSFGAMIRNYYTCTVTLFEDKYRVENLKFSE